MRHKRGRATAATNKLDSAAIKLVFSDQLFHLLAHFSAANIKYTLRRLFNAQTKHFRQRMKCGQCGRAVSSRESTFGNHSKRVRSTCWGQRITIAPFRFDHHVIGGIMLRWAQVRETRAIKNPFRFSKACILQTGDMSRTWAHIYYLSVSMAYHAAARDGQRTHVQRI